MNKLLGLLAAMAAIGYGAHWYVNLGGSKKIMAALDEAKQATANSEKDAEAHTLKHLSE